MAAFLEGRLKWGGIAEVVGDTLWAHKATKLLTVEDVLEVDAEARSFALLAVEQRDRAA